LLTVSEGKSITIMMRNVAAGRHGTGEVAESLPLISKTGAGKRETERQRQRQRERERETERQSQKLGLV
jgi:predicted Ser/Thr protein kinase